QSSDFEQKALAFVGASGRVTRWIGTTIPVELFVDLSEPARKMVSGLAGTAIAVEISILKGRLFISCLSTENDMPTLRNQVENSVRFVLNSFGFLNGLWIDIDLRYVVENDNSLASFSTGNEAVRINTSKFSLNFNELAVLCMCPYLDFAISDYSNALRVALDTGFFCYRAVEAVMQSFKVRSMTSKDSQAWSAMNKSLNLQSSYVMNLIKPLADPRRHADPTFTITDSERTACLIACSNVIYRYAKFLQIKESDLKVSDYPILQ
ncbi:MAG: hypothetical protein KC777_17925, partial [Cyanobacteria bacterium HKST-UBA02]|nr:hypothetical protein [Cyanobacteria bacterium HKST-UBA02]